MNKNHRANPKVTVLISRIEDDCHSNIANLIRDGQAAAKPWEVEWDAPCWEVSKVFAHTKRSHRSERRALNFWFTERGEKLKIPGAPFQNPFGDIVRSMLVLRHQAGNQCFGDQQQIIIASQFIYLQLAERNHDLMTLVPGDLDAACQAISATQAETTAYKLHRFVEAFAATLDRNRLCPTLLNFHYSKKQRPISVGGLDYARLDDPDLAAGASAKLIPELAMQALGILYQTIPAENFGDRLLINVVVIAACTGRRIGEILTLPNQRIQYDRNGHAFLLYYKEKRSQGNQITVLEKLFLIPQTIQLVKAAIDESVALTTEVRASASRIAASGEPDTIMFPQQEYLSNKEIGNALGLSPTGANAWCKTRQITMYKVGRSTRYLRKEIIDAIRGECFEGPAVHVTPPANNLELEDLLFITHKWALNAGRGALKYAVLPVNVQHVGDFLGARGTGAFKRYMAASEQASLRINSHQFRHTLNTVLQNGGMSDALQTEWFARKNPADTKAYQHMTPAERAFAAHQSTARRFDVNTAPLLQSTHAEAIAVAQNFPILDVGPGCCQHDWRVLPCPRHLESSVSADSMNWVGADSKCRLAELVRLREISEIILAQAKDQAAAGLTTAEAWVNHLHSKLVAICAAIENHDNSVCK